MSLLTRAKAIREKEKFSLQSTQLQADETIAPLVRRVQRVFDPQDLHENGIETDLHVTVFYGLDNVDVEQIAPIVARFMPFDVTFGRTSLFENPEFDVVKVDVESPQLRELHAQIAKLPNRNEREVYQPHMTIAYVKPGAGRKYLIDPVNGRTMRVNFINFSDKEGNKIAIPLAGKREKASQCAICGKPATESLYRTTGGKFVSEKSEMAVCTKCGDRIKPLLRESTKPGKSPGASIKNPRVYEALRKRGYSKERAAAISNSMLVSSTKELAEKRADAAVSDPLTRAKELRQTAVSLTIFKQADGQYRWITRSSNAFRDRDGEIVSVKALADDVARADTTKEYGPLRFWHMPGVDIGDADYNWMRGRTLIESGTFRDPAVAEKVASKAADYQISIGFRHPADQPDENGVFHNIRRFERSLVPAGRAANPFTSLSVHKENNMDDSTKQNALKALLDGDDTQLKAILAGADSSEKTADSMGVTFKDDGVVLGDLTADQLLEYAIANKELQIAEEAKTAEAEAQSTKMDKKKVDEGEEKKPDEKMDYATKMGGMVEKMGGYMDRMEKMFGKSEKSADDMTAVNGAVNAHSGRIATLEATIKEQSELLATATKELNELKADIPTGLGEGLRPTQQEDNIIGTDEKTTSKNGASALDAMVDFILPSAQ